ncbi:MAG TPA: TadE family protein [Roseiflexaceae bacterium]|jgi:Flp pilus assembly protein TadG|nr:TadE family protein [Roseiflexaceae bacterium]
MMKRTRRRGQAIVEFALSATLIFFMLCAAIDLGMIFFAVQGLRNAAQEGATYGSRWLVFDGSGRRVLDIDTIRDKVRTESGTGNRMGFVNLLDLNGDGIDDENQSGVIASHIAVQMLSDSPDYDGNPLNNGTAPNYTACTNAATAGPSECYIYITVSNDHKLIFPLSPVFTDTVKITSSYVLPIRDSYSQGSGTAPTPIPDTQPTPTQPSANDFKVAISSPSNGAVITSRSAMVGQATITTNNTGSSVKNVTFNLYYIGNGNSTLISTSTDATSPYCLYGNGSCSSIGTSAWNGLAKGNYRLDALATTQSGMTASASVTFSIK